jgi:ComF family protein
MRCKFYTLKGVLSKLKFLLHDWISAFQQWMKALIHIIMPQHCVICNGLLSPDELGLCTSCLENLPYTNLYGIKGNWFERYCWGQIPVVRASAYLKYLPATDSRIPFVALKYNNRPDIARLLGTMMANELVDTDFFSTIDYIVPIPLSKERKNQRGYNQSLEIALGISDVTHIPIREDLVVRKISNETQTHLTSEQRRENVKGIFEYIGHDVVDSPHILLVDDIFTTGSTLFSCAKSFGNIQNIHFSILVLGVSRQYPYFDTLDNHVDEDALLPFN